MASVQGDLRSKRTGHGLAVGTPGRTTVAHLDQTERPFDHLDPKFHRGSHALINLRSSCAASGLHPALIAPAAAA
jgi:hypothetical protein